MTKLPLGDGARRTRRVGAERPTILRPRYRRRYVLLRRRATSGATLPWCSRPRLTNRHCHHLQASLEEHLERAGVKRAGVVAAALRDEDVETIDEVIALSNEDLEVIGTVGARRDDI